MAEAMKQEMAADQAKAPAATANQAQAEAVAAAEGMAYIPRVEIRKFTAEKGTDRFSDGTTAIVKGEIKNLGDRTLDEVELTFTLLDKDGRGIHEETYHPVLVSAMSFGRDNGPLKPNYVRTFGAGFENAPSEWSGKIEAKVTAVKFAKAE